MLLFCVLEEGGGGGGGIISVVCSVILSKGFKPFLSDLHESNNMTHLLSYFFVKKIPLSRRVGYVMEGSMGQ